MQRVEFVGGPRCGERREVEETVNVIRFQVGRGKKAMHVLYRRRPKPGKNDVVYYDYSPPVAA